MKMTAVLGTIRESSDSELRERIKRLEEELFQHRLKRYTNQLAGTHLIRLARREIARCQTVLAARQHGHEGQQKKAEAAEGKE